MSEFIENDGFRCGHPDLPPRHLKSPTTFEPCPLERGQRIEISLGHAFQCDDIQVRSVSAAQLNQHHLDRWNIEKFSRKGRDQFGRIIRPDLYYHIQIVRGSRLSIDRRRHRADKCIRNACLLQRVDKLKQP